MARLVKKTLFVGVFAYIMGNWNNLARIVFESFAGLGLKGVSGTSFTDGRLSCAPASVAQTGLDAGRPLLESISGLMGYVVVLRELHPDRRACCPRLGAGPARLLHPRHPALRQRSSNSS